MVRRTALTRDGGLSEQMLEWVGRNTIAGYMYLAALATLFSQAFLDLVVPSR